MSGPFIKIGDLVKLTNTQGISTYYNIIDIDDKIPLSITIASFLNYNDQKIIKKHLDGRQNIDDEVYTLQYLGKGQVSSRDVFMAGINEIDINILLQLDDESLAHVCQVDEYVRSLCNSDDLWRRRLEMNYPGVLEYINPNISMKENYINFSRYSIDLNGIDMAVVDGNIEFVQWIHQHDSSLFTNYNRLFYRAADHGHVDLMDWFMKFEEDSPYQIPSGLHLEDSLVLESAIQGDHPQVLQWMQSRGLNVNIDVYVLRELVMFDSYKIMRSIKDQILDILRRQGILDNARYPGTPSPLTPNGLVNRYLIDEFLRGNQGPRTPEMLDVLMSISPSITLNRGTISRLIERCDVDVVRYILDNHLQIPSKVSINNAARIGCVEVLELLVSRNTDFTPTVEGANHAAAGGHLDVLIFMSRLNPPTYPSSHGINRAVKSKQRNVLEWIIANPNIPINLRNQANAGLSKIG
jgi:hypothetical protein